MSWPEAPATAGPFRREIAWIKPKSSAVPLNDSPDELCPSPLRPLRELPELHAFASFVFAGLPACTSVRFTLVPCKPPALAAPFHEPVWWSPAAAATSPAARRGRAPLTVNCAACAICHDCQPSAGLTIMVLCNA